MKIKLLLSSLLLIGCTCPSSTDLLAKIGENESQIESRYGKSTAQWEDGAGYVKRYDWRGLTVSVVFVNGISQRESFHRVWPDHPERDPDYDQKIERQMKVDKQLLAEIEGLGKNGVVLADDSGYAFIKAKN